MKRVLISALLLLPALTCFAKPNESEYSITVHVQSAHLSNDCKSFSSMMRCFIELRLNVMIDGKKYELEGDTDSNILTTGTYQAKLSTNEHATAYEYKQTYEFLFPDGQKQKFRVIGESE